MRYCLASQVYPGGIFPGISRWMKDQGFEPVGKFGSALVYDADACEAKIGRKVIGLDERQTKGVTPMPPKPDIVVKLTTPEFDAIIASLRWTACLVQSNGWGDFEEIADNNKEHPALTAPEIDRLCNDLLNK